MVAKKESIKAMVTRLAKESAQAAAAAVKVIDALGLTDDDDIPGEEALAKVYGTAYNKEAARLYDHASAEQKKRAMHNQDKNGRVWR